MSFLISGSETEKFLIVGVQSLVSWPSIWRPQLRTSCYTRGPGAIRCHSLGQPCEQEWLQILVQKVQWSRFHLTLNLLSVCLLLLVIIRFPNRWNKRLPTMEVNFIKCLNWLLWFGKCLFKLWAGSQGPSADCGVTCGWSYWHFGSSGGFWLYMLVDLLTDCCMRKVHGQEVG